MPASSELETVAPGTYRWQVVIMLWCVCFFNYADRQAIFSVFPLLQREFHLSPVQLGLLGSSFAWVYALAGPLAGRLADVIRRRVAVLAGLEIWSMICAATALSNRFGTLLLLRGAEGLGESIYFPASMSMISAYHPEKTRSRAFGLHQTSIYVGTIVGGLIAGSLAERFGWRAAFVVFGGAGMLLGLVLARFLREPGRSTAGAGGLSFLAMARLLMSRPHALLLMLAFGAMNGVAVVQLSWLPSFLYQRFALGLAQAALYATLTAQVGAGLGALAGGWLADRRARRPGGRVDVQILGAACAVPAVLVCGLSRTLPLTLAALFCWGFFKGLYDANIFASLFDTLPVGVRGTSTGIMNSAGWLLGGTTAPVLIGYFSALWGLGNAIAFAATGYVLAAGLLLAAARGMRAVTAAPQCSLPN